MKSPLFRYCFGMIILPSCLTLAQTSPNATGRDSDATDVLVLSPFVVDSSADEGYSSSVSTSGSRLRTDLKDVAASVTVLTNEFMDDLAANDIAAAMAFVAGAENDSTTHQEGIAGLGSSNGYVGGDFGDNNNRSGEIRVRGLGRASTTFNYFEVIGSTDRYNTDRTEFLRGANSILFGLAEPAGLVNSSTKVAKLRDRFTRIETKFDDFGSSRVILDFNQPLIKDQLGIRAVALYNDQRYKVKTAAQRDERLFVTGTWQPFKNTTIRAFVEDSNSNGRRPNNRTVQDNVSEWLTAYNTYAPQMNQAQIDAAFFWDPLALPSATGGIAPTSVFTLGNGQTVDLGLIRRPLDTRANGTTLIYNGNGDWLDPFGGVVTLAANRTITGGAISPTNTRTQFMRSGSDRENNPSFRADPQVTDKGIFPYDTVEIAALPGSYRSENDRRFHASLDQKVTEDFYLSFGVQHEEWEQEQYFAVLTQTNQISLDINKNLPDGRTNPNFLRPFVYGRNIAEYNDATSTSYLAQANYDIDFREKTSNLGWLGRHRLTSLYTSTESDRFGYRWHYMFDSDIPGVFPAANMNATNASRWVMQQWYVGDAVQLGDTALRFTEFPSTTAAAWDRSYDYLFFNNTKNPRVWETSPEKLSTSRNLLTGGRNYTIQKNDGFGTSLQSFFWDDRIVTLLGWRTDSVESFQGVPINLTAVPFPQVPGASRNEYEATGAEFSNRADTTTQSIVYKINDKLRVFINRSENFAATAPRQDNLYRFIDPQSGKTTDYGVGLTLMDGKLDIRTTIFESSQVNATSSTGVAGIRVVAFEDVIYNALDQAGRLAEWNTINPFGGSTTERYERPNNAATTEDRVSKGYSVEVSYRPTRNWDLVAAFDKLDNVTTRVGSELGEFLAIRAPFYQKYFTEGLRIDGTTTTTSTLIQDRFVDTIATNYVNEILGEGTSNRGIAEYTGKLVARYKFLEGRLKGLNIGTSLRWESGKILGYGEVPSTFNFGGLNNFPGKVSDTTNEHVGDSIIAGGMFVSYSRKILNDRVRWKVQLNAQNILNSEQGLRVIAANADGSPVWGIAPPKTFELSNSFDF